MINLGPYPGKALPEIHVKARIIDHVMEAIAILLLAAGWVITLLFRNRLPETVRGEFLGLACMATLILLLMLWSQYASIKYFNFPVKVTEHNMVVQYLLITRFMRVISIFAGITILLAQFSYIESLLDVKEGLFKALASLLGLLMVSSIVIYYIIARKYR